MTSRTKLSFLTLAAVVPALVFGTGLSSAVAADENVTDSLVTSALEELGIEVTDENVLAELEESVNLALDEQIIDPAIVEEIEQGLAEGNLTTEEITTPEVNPELGELIDENLNEQTEVWEETAPSWIAAFEQVRADFELCRTDGQSTSECARTFGFQLQLAHSEAKLADIDAALARVSSLPEEEQAAALAELEAQRSAFQAKLERTAVRLSAAVATGNAGASSQIQERLNTVITEVQGRSSAPALPEQALNGSPSTPNSGSQGNGNAPVTIPQAPAPQSGSVTVEQAPGNSGNAGRPENPGSQGQNNRNNR
jgi:hypothetical protein